MAKLGAARGFYMVYLYTCELYPTDIRTTAVGCSSVCARHRFSELGIQSLYGTRTVLGGFLIVFYHTRWRWLVTKCG